MSASNQNFAQRGVIIVKKFLAVMLAVLVLTSCAAFAEDEEVKVGILAFQSSTVDVGQGQAEIIGEAPIFSIFLNEKSRPNEKSRNITPMSAHRWMFSESATDAV